MLINPAEKSVFSDIDSWTVDVVGPVTTSLCLPPDTPIGENQRIWVLGVDYNMLVSSVDDYFDIAYMGSKAIPIRLLRMKFSATAGVINWGSKVFGAYGWALPWGYKFMANYGIGNGRYLRFSVQWRVETSAKLVPDYQLSEQVDWAKQCTFIDSLLGECDLNGSQ